MPPGKKVTVPANVDTTIRLKVNGEVITSEGRELSARLNAVVAFWNTILVRNDPPGQLTKLTADTGPAQTATRALGDEPFRDR